MAKQILTVQPTDEDQRIEKFLRQLGISYITASQIVRKGNVKINGERKKQSTIIHSGDVIEVFGIDPLVKSTPLRKEYKGLADEIMNDLLYKDDNILILNKPAGIAVQGGNKVKISIDDLAEYFKFNLEDKPKLVHRLDRDTSGILVMARNTPTAKVLSEMFKASGTIKKYYLALCHGYPNQSEGTISIPLAKTKFDKEIVSYSSEIGDRAITHYKVLKHNTKFSLIKFQIITGRTHQIRAHCGISGIPVIGDNKYNCEYFDKVQSILSNKNFTLNTKRLTQYKYNKLCLHSQEIEFELFDKKIIVNAPIPIDFQLMINKLL